MLQISRKTTQKQQQQQQQRKPHEACSINKRVLATLEDLAIIQLAATNEQQRKHTKQHTKRHRNTH